VARDIYIHTHTHIYEYRHISVSISLFIYICIYKHVARELGGGDRLVRLLPFAPPPLTSLFVTRGQVSKATGGEPQRYRRGGRGLRESARPQASGLAQSLAPVCGVRRLPEGSRRDIGGRELARR